MVGRERSALPEMDELDGRQVLLLQAHPQRRQRAMGARRRPLRHGAHRRLGRRDNEGMEEPPFWRLFSFARAKDQATIISHEVKYLGLSAAGASKTASRRVSTRDTGVASA